MNKKLNNQSSVLLGTGELTIEQIIDVARYGRKVDDLSADNEKTSDVYHKVQESRDWVKKILANTSDDCPTIYGINTGFGAKAGRIPLNKENIPWVSRNLMVSHASGSGEFLAPEIIRAALLIRANSLALGYSGVTVELINKLVEMLNKGICPVVPEYGSLGASGDLAPLSHIGLVLSEQPDDSNPIDADSKVYDESGQAYLEKRPEIYLEDAELKTELVIEKNGHKTEYALLSGHEAMRKRGIKPLVLQAKEGLALNNGATFSAAIGVLALYDAENIARHAEIAAALSLESFLGFRDAFFPHIQKVRKQTGQIEVAKRILKFVEGSTLLDGSEKENPRVAPPQDSYSLRVTPQVIGAVWDTLEFIRKTLENEINAATDNPLIFTELERSYKAVSGANFHGAPIGYAMDFLKIVMTDLMSLCERRIYKLTNPNLSFGLPSMIIEDEKKTPGLTSGMMIPQYLAAGLVSDCKTLAHPASVDSIPSCAGQEDHVSMSMNAARHARKIVQNAEVLVGIELLCASLALKWRIKALETRKKKKGEIERVRKIAETKRNRADEKILFLENKECSAGTGSGKARTIIEDYLFTGEERLPSLGEEPTKYDRYMHPYILQITKLLQLGDIVENVYSECGISDGIVENFSISGDE